MRICLVFKQELHNCDVACQGGGQKRCLPRKIDPFERSGYLEQVMPERRSFLGARVYVSAFGNQLFNDFEDSITIDVVLESTVVEVKITHIDCFPERTAAVPVLIVDKGILFNKEMGHWH